MADDGTAIAVVGMAVTFPAAPDLETYRDNLERGVDAISEVPPGRWDPVYYDPAAAGVDRFYTRYGGFVGADALLDPVALGVVPSTVEAAEPDQLLTLALAARALVTAGGEELGERRRRAGVIVGRGGYLTPGLARLDQRVRTSEQLVAALRAVVPSLTEDELADVKAAFVARLGPDRPDAAIDLVPNLAASRVANRLDLGGPAYTVDAACASSLLAVDQAVTELTSGRCDLVIAGGVHLCHDVTIWSVFTQLGALSPSGRIRPFHRDADGLLIGEGGGMIVLERLADAERRGAHVHAVIRGVGVSSDGRGASLMRPSVAGQLLALERAWDRAGLDPASVGLVEAHGTATPTGDAAELDTLARFFGQPSASAPAAGIGSVKSMIGHAMPAAGIAGLVKTVLAVESGVMPPTLHCEEPNPLLARTRFRAVAEAGEWPVPGPRRAGVNAFGFGGINAHVVVEEHRPAHPRRGARSRADAGAPRPGAGEHAPPGAVLLLAAPDAAGIAAALEGRPPGAGAEPWPEGEGPARLALPDPTAERLELARKVVARGHHWPGRNDCWFTPGGLLRPSAGGQAGKLAFLFPGVEPSFEPRVEDVARHLDVNPPDPVAPDAAASDLEGLGRAIVAVGRLLHAAVLDLGIRADLVAGQSIGEWSGMIATEMIPPDEIDRFIATLKPGSLDVPGVVFAALGCGVEAAGQLADGLAGIAVSHDNCPRQTIVCGNEAQVTELLGRARTAKVLAQVLPFRSGFHTHMFEPFLGPFREALARLPLQQPTVPLWSATTCQPYPEGPADVRALALAHLVERVRFRELTTALHDAGARVFVQVGPGSLPGLVDDTLRGREFLAIGANTPRREGLAQLLRVAAACWVEGFDDVRFDRLAGQPAPRLRPAAGRRGGGLRSLPLDTPLVRLPQRAGRRAAIPAVPGADLSAQLGEVAARGGPEAAVAAELGALLGEIEASAALVAEVLAGAPQSPARVPTVEAVQVPRSGTTSVTLSVDAEPAFADHCFYRQPPGWPVVSDRFPVVPMTGLVQMMADAACELSPGLVAVALEDVRALRWLAVAPPVTIDVRAEELPAEPGSGERRVRVTIEGYARATVVLAPAFPAAPAPACPALAATDELAVTAETLYADRWLFHGPAYQGVRRLGALGPAGIDGELEVGAAPGALLDNAGQLMGFWIMYRHTDDRLGLPTSIDRIAFFGPQPPVGERLETAVRIAGVDTTAVRADLELVHRGEVWARVDGWEDRRFDSDEVVWPVLIWPERSLLTERHPGGFEVASERWRSSASRELMMRRYLGEAEREEYARHNPRAQRLFLLGRIAAKDAVRRHLFDAGEELCWPVEVAVSNEEGGRPLVTVPRGPTLHVSIAHTPYVGVAVVGEREPVGIDVERVEPRTDSFAAAAFTPGELEILLAGGGDERDERLTRGWAMKEAVAKAAGTGLGGRPRDFVISEIEQDVALVNGRAVGSTRLGDVVVAWTLPSGEAGGMSR